MEGEENLTSHREKAAQFFFIAPWLPIIWISHRPALLIERQYRAKTTETLGPNLEWGKATLSYGCHLPSCFPLRENSSVGKHAENRGGRNPVSGGWQQKPSQQQTLQFHCWWAVSIFLASYLWLWLGVSRKPHRLWFKLHFVILLERFLICDPMIGPAEACVSIFKTTIDVEKMWK